MVRPGRRLKTTPPSTAVCHRWRNDARWRNAKVTRWLLTACLLMGCSGLTGCARSLKTIRTARASFAQGDLAAARQTLLKVADENRRLADAASLDLAMVELAEGDPQAAEQRLRKLRDRFDQLPEIAPVQETIALATDDTARVFRPAGYEEVMLRSMLAICSLAHDQFDAESYTLQAMSKQTELARRAEERGLTEVAQVYQPIAVAPYLRGILREATHHDYDDATRAYQLVSSVRPQFAPAQEDIRRASGGTHSAPGHGVLYVIACVGRGPVLEETDAPTTTFAMQIASTMFNALNNQEQDEQGRNSRDLPTLPNIASVKVPRVSSSTSMDRPS